MKFRRNTVVIKLYFSLSIEKSPSLPQRERKGERRNIRNVYRNVERAFKENVRKKKSIMLSTFAFQSATLLPSQQLDATSLLISLSIHGWNRMIWLKKKKEKKKAKRPRAIDVSLSSSGRLLKPRRLRVAQYLCGAGPRARKVNLITAN